MTTLWNKLRDFGILRREPQNDVAAECVRFKSDQAFQQYMAEATFNIITQLYALSEGDIEQFQQLKRSQMALEGFSNYIDTAIMSERMKTRNNPAD